MKRRMFLTLPVVALGGCSAVMPTPGGALGDLLGGSSSGTPTRAAYGVGRPGGGDFELIQQKSKLMQEMMGSPDLPAWHEQREKMALAVGDRVFDRPFDRVFDSMTVALATLGARVNNMERTSGYITGSIPDLGPTKTKALQQEALRQYAMAKGYNPKVAEPSGSMFDMDAGGMSSMMTRGMAGLTLSMVRQSKTQTKVKLRFDNVYYPVLVSEYYNLVWAAVDKQMFLDRALD